MRTHYNFFAGGDVGRIEALSDGIFAFAATVLVLDFRSPEPADIHSEAELLQALGASAHRLMPWLLSLLTLGIFWIAQQTQLSQLARSNRDLTWLHLTFLAIITVLPFTTRLLADFFTYRTAFLIYWANLFLLGLAVYVIWAYAERAKLLRDDAPAELSGAFRRRVIIAQSLYAVGALVGLAERAARARADHPDPAQLRHRAEAAGSIALVAAIADRGWRSRRPRLQRAQSSKGNPAYCSASHGLGVRRALEVVEFAGLDPDLKVVIVGKDVQELGELPGRRTAPQTRRKAMSE